MPRYNNGRIPSNMLYKLDSGHVTSWGTAVRWLMFRLDVYEATGVWLYITPGDNAYRDYDSQVSTRNYFCNQGNCNQAAYPGTSSHGGNYKGVDAMALDIGNYWAIAWYIFKSLAEKWGFSVGEITAAQAGIDEPWHIIDREPFDAPTGLTLVQDGDGVWNLPKPKTIEGVIDMFMFYPAPDEWPNTQAYLGTYEGRILKVKPLMGIEAKALVAARPEIPKVQLTREDTVELCRQGGYTFDSTKGGMLYDGTPGLK